MNNTTQPPSESSFRAKVAHLQTTLANVIKFHLRRLSKKQRGIRFEHKESKKELFKYVDKAEQKKTFDHALELREKFHLDRFWEKTSKDNLRFNLFYIEMLDKALTLAAPRIPEILEVADIGSSNWPYVQGLHAAIKWWRSPAGRQLHLTGFEIDPYRVNEDYHSWIDHAGGHLDGLKNVDYLPRKFRAQANSYHVITIVLPLVFPQDHLDWGLPMYLFNPNLLLNNAWKSLKPGGILIIINKNRAEHLAQREIMLVEEIEPLVGFPHESIYYDFEQVRHVLVSVKGNVHMR